MTMPTDDDKFLNSAKRALREAEENLDPATIARLRAARRTAIEDGLRAKSFAWRAWLLPVGGVVTAGLVAITAATLWFSPPPNLIQANVDDVELLTAHESPEFFADMEFYSWLADDDDNDAS